MLESHALAAPAQEAPGAPAEAGAAVTILLAAPRGFCAGVRRAIAAVTDAIAVHGAPVYVRRAIVHNRAVVRALEAQGAVFVEEVDEVPPGAVLVLSAHGVAPAVTEAARRRAGVLYDAVCPLVAKVHREVVRHHREGRHVVLIGHRGHPEIVGTLGHLPDGAASLVASAADVAALPLPRDTPVGYAVQTTYSVDEAAGIVAALEARFSDLAGPAVSDICYATTNRQAALRRIAPRVDAMIVAGEHFSSNACRLAELAQALGCRSVQLVASPSAIGWAGLSEARSIGITAAASTPDETVTAILEALGARMPIVVEEVSGPHEARSFKPVRVG